MSDAKGRVIGFVVLVAIIGGGVAYKLMDGGLAPATKVVGAVSSEKIAFVTDPDVVAVLKKKHGIELDYRKSGSLEMAKDPPAGADFLWPASQGAVEVFKTRHADRKVTVDAIFQSPIVIYSWDLVVKALVSKNLATKTGDAYFITDFPALVKLAIEGRSWKELGVDELYGKISIFSTDPTKSNSASMFAGLLATILVGDVVEEKTLPDVKDKIRAYFARLGHLEQTSSDLWDNFLRMGVGSKPMAVGYENQLVEFSLQHQDVWSSVRDRIAILYPVPTVWSTHTVIGLTDAGTRFAKALADPELQRLAWEKHGFRSGMIGVTNDPKVLKIAGIPERIDKVVPNPAPLVMEQLEAALARAP